MRTEEERERRRLEHIRARLTKGLARVEAQLARNEQLGEREKTPKRPKPEGD